MEAGDGGDVDMEWEMEQLRRGGHTGTQTSVKEANNVYKPAPGKRLTIQDRLANA